MGRSTVHVGIYFGFLIFGVLTLFYLSKVGRLQSVKGFVQNFTIDESRSAYEEMRSLMNEQKDRRVAQLRGAYVHGNNAIHATLYNVMVPEVFCPSLLRIGDENDGGKWICRPHALPKGCAIYSLGVYDDTTFEREIQNITNKRCRVHSFDQNEVGDTVKRLSEINGDFTVALVSDVDNPKTKERNIKTLMKNFGDDSIEILKIDIEGSEFKVMPILLNSVKMCQILIEIHGKPVAVVKLINQFANAGFRLFSHEINGEYPKMCEYSFIHESCMEKYSAKPLAYYWHLVQ